MTWSAILTSQDCIFVGNATRDVVFFVPHLPTNDEVCVASRQVRCLGGRGVVPALVASALGMSADVCTVIGTDLRVVFEEFLESHQVNTDAIKWDPSGRSTTKYVAFIGEDSGDSVAVALAPALDWHAADVQRESVAAAS